MDEDLPTTVATVAQALATYCPKIPNDTYDLREIHAGIHDLRPMVAYCREAANFANAPMVKTAAKAVGATCVTVAKLLYPHFRPPQPTPFEQY